MLRRSLVLVAAAACGPATGVQQPVVVAADAADAIDEPAGPAPAPGVDGNLPAPEYASWLGATDREAIVWLGSRQARREYFAVVDLETGCLVETHARFETLYRALNTTWFRTDLEGKKKPDTIDMSTAGFADELAGLVKWLGRFGLTRLPGHVAWSRDGEHVLFATTDWMFRSRDGGATLLRVDGVASYEPQISPDGRWGTYRRCDTRTGRCQYRVALLPLDAERPPTFVGDGDVKDVHFDPGGGLVYARAGKELCIERADVVSRRVKRVACARTDVRSEDVFFVSPRLAYGALEIVDKVDPPRSGFRLFSLADGQSVRDIRGTRSAAPPIDDIGRIGWPEGIFPKLRAHVSDAAGDKIVGDGDPIGWDGRGRLVIKTAAISPGPARKLGNPACGLIRAVP